MYTHANPIDKHKQHARITKQQNIHVYEKKNCRRKENTTKKKTNIHEKTTNQYEHEKKNGVHSKTRNRLHANTPHAVYENNTTTRTRKKITDRRKQHKK